MDLDEYQQNEARIRNLQQEIDQLRGRLSQLKEQAEKEFGCKDLKQLKLLIAKAKEEEQLALANYQKQSKDWLQWEEKLEGSHD